MDDAAVEQAIARLQQRAAKFEAVDGRGATDGDTVVADIERQVVGQPTEADTHNDVNVKVKSESKPTRPGSTSSSSASKPALRNGSRSPLSWIDYAVKKMAGKDVWYAVTVKAIKRRVLPALDDEFAKDLGNSKRSTPCAPACAPISSTRPGMRQSATSARS